MPEEKAFYPFRQDMVNYNTASPNMPGELCANCLFFKASDYDDGELIGARCHLVESWPLDILATGYCDRYEMLPEPPEPEPMPVTIVEQGREALYLTPKTPSLLQKTARAITGKPQPGITIAKAGDRRLAIIYTSNGYKDREQEHVAQAALKAYTDDCFDDAGEFKGTNVLDFWHEPKLVIGDCLWADMQDGFLVEVFQENDRPLSKELWDYWEQNPDNIDWAASQLFFGLEFDPEGNVWKTIQKRRTTVLSLEAAANSLTLSEVIPMAKSRQEVFDGIFASRGVANAHELLKTGGSQAVKNAMLEAGIQPKEASTETDAPQLSPDDATEARIINLEKQFGALVEGLDETLTITDELTATVGTQKDASEGYRQEIDTVLTELKDTVKALTEKLGEAPKRASEAPETDLGSEQPAAAKGIAPDVIQADVATFGQAAFIAQEGN